MAGTLTNFAGTLAEILDDACAGTLRNSAAAAAAFAGVQEKSAVLVADFSAGGAVTGRFGGGDFTRGNLSAKPALAKAAAAGSGFDAEAGSGFGTNGGSGSDVAAATWSGSVLSLPGEESSTALLTTSESSVAMSLSHPVLSSSTM